MKKCENCGNEHDGSHGSGRFCSVKCSKGFSTKAKRKEINEKVSNKLFRSGHQNIKKICLQCNNEFEISWNKRNQIYCSRKCSGKLKGDWSRAHNKLSKDDWSKINKKSYIEGKNYVSGGTTKWYDYKDIRVQGTYELRTCKILDRWKDEGKIKNWEYTNDRISYIGIDEKPHTYLLDFKIFNLDGSFEYLETKGYKSETDLFKWKAVRDKGHKLTVWYHQDILNYENVK